MRRLKAFKIKTVMDPKSGTKFDIEIDRQTKMFKAKVFGVEVEASTAAECKQLAITKIRELVQYQWRTVVVIETQSSYHEEQGNVGLLFEVHELAPCPDTGWVRRTKSFDDEVLIQPYYGPTESVANKGVYVIPWSESVVVALQTISDRIDILRQQLQLLLGSANVCMILTQAVDRLLPLPKTEG